MDPDPNPAIFVTDLQEGNKKLILKSHKVTKQKESRFFLLFLLSDRRIRIRLTNGSGRPQNIVTNPTDPDPQYWLCGLPLGGEEEDDLCNI
jgi:hypothetical protein